MSRLRTLFIVFAAIGSSVGWSADVAAPPESALHMRQRSRVLVDREHGAFQVVEERVAWDPRKTALVICDMWNQHWCRGATARVAEMVPRMNEVTAAARKRGILVIHSPSDTMKFYADAPGRKLAQSAPAVPTLSQPAGWCARGGGQEPPLPFDNSRDRCDCVPQCPHGNPWSRQIAELEIRDGDAVTDNLEAFYLMKQRGIENVLLMGVHTNMCVLGRPFSIRRMTGLGQRVALIRDLTDCIRDSQMPPEGLDHFRATDLVIEHIEKYWCPTITSSDVVAAPAFAFAEDRRPHVVFMVGEDEYQTEATLPRFAAEELDPLGFRSTFAHADATDKNRFPALAAVKSADLLLVSVRRRLPPAAELDLVRGHVAAGKPLVGIRTASHAFATRGDAPPEGHAAWPEFDAEVLGGNYQGHHGNHGEPKTLIAVADGAADHPLVRGWPAGESVTSSWLYKTSPLKSTATPLLIGRVEGREPPEPAAWINVSPQGGRVFYTSLGHPDDFQLPAFRQMLAAAVSWGLEKK